MAQLQVVKLPVEEDTETRRKRVQDLIFEFNTVDPGQVVSGDGQNRCFNDFGEEIIRASNPVKSVDELVAAINKYSYPGSHPGLLKGQLAFVLSCSCYYWCRRQTVPEGYLGHYVSSGRHRVVEPGFHALISCTEWWKTPFRVDGSDANNNMIELGSKTILYVPENHYGGAYRICDKTDETTKNTADGEYILFPSGRYVLESAKYRRVSVTPLRRAEGVYMGDLGPLKIVCIKEGFLGGAYKISEGKYVTLEPGPPYILHSMDYESIQVKERKDCFILGPLTFVTIRDGQLGGAFDKRTGLYHVLPPGNTYKLHSKDYAFDPSKDRQDRTSLFQLGSYWFVTVNEEQVAGAFRRRGGAWQDFPSGDTYQLSIDDYEKPIRKKLNKAVIKCGPLTYLTVQEDSLVGAWRVADGKFVEFNDHTKQEILHERDYHTIVNINKYEIKEQEFGPKKVITIPEGRYGVFEKKGEMEIKPPGFYKLSYEYIIRPSLPANVQSFTVLRNKFRTKDGTELTINATFLWQVGESVDEVRKCAIICEDIKFYILSKKMETLFKTLITKYCKIYTRSELLPTKQEMIIKAGTDISAEKLAQILAIEKQNTAELYKHIEEMVQKDMQQTVDDSGWGLVISKGEDGELTGITLEGFALSNDDQSTNKIISNLSQITVSLLKASEERIKGDLQIEKAEIKKTVAMKKIDAETFVKKQKANTRAEVRKIKANSNSEVTKINSAADAQTRITRLESENAVKVLLSTTDAKADSKAKEISIAIECKEIKEKAQTEAKTIDLLSNAYFQRVCKENEAAAKMSTKQFELMKGDLGVQAMTHIGNAEWRMPSKVLQFYESFSPYLRMGPISAQELLGNLKEQKDQ